MNSLVLKLRDIFQVKHIVICLVVVFITSFMPFEFPFPKFFLPGWVITSPAPGDSKDSGLLPEVRCQGLNQRVFGWPLRFFSYTSGCSDNYGGLNPVALIINFVFYYSIVSFTAMHLRPGKVS